MIGAHYPFVNLGELAAQQKGSVAIGPFGSRMKADVYVPSGMPVIRGTNISGGKSLKGEWVYVTDEFAAGLPNCILSEGDLVFPHRGAIGEVAIVQSGEAPMLLSTSMMKFRPDTTRASSSFLYYFFSSKLGRAEMMQFASQVGTPGIGQPLSSLRKFKVPLPPLPIQDAIAETLGALDDKIEVNRRMNGTLEAMARAVFRDWFVDFGPTRRQMAGASDPLAILGGLIQNAEEARRFAPLFPAALGDNGLPEGWEERTIEDVSQIVGGSTPSTKNEEFWQDGQHAWATPKDLSKLPGIFIGKTERHITDAGLAKVGSGLSPAGSVLLSSRAPVGYLAIAEQPLTVNQGFIVMRPTPAFPTEFAYFWCKENMETIKANANGSTFQEISKKNFRPLLVASPDERLLKSFTTTAKGFIDLIRIREAESRTLAATRDLLLPKLMSGEIRLKDAEGVT